MQVMIVKEHFFSIGVAVLLLMTVHFGVNMMVPPPQQDAFFPNNLPRYVGQSDSGYAPELKQRIETAHREWTHAQRKHQSIISTTYLPLGLLTLVVGSFWLRMEVLSAAFIFGGLFLMIGAIASGWESNAIRFASSLLTLASVLLIVRRKFGSPGDRQRT